MNPILEVRGLCYAYEEGRPALDGVSFAVSAGERIALLGANGAGKSTLFLCLNGVLTPEAGELVLHGAPMTRRTRQKQAAAVGIVFQNADEQILAPTVEAEISFGPMNLRLPREEVIRRVDDAVAQLGLEDFRRRAPHALSGGEKKRVTIADIVAMNSEIFLLDEPAASLDPAGMEQLDEVLNGLHADGRALVIATHDMDFAWRWADRVLVMAGGRLLADGRPETVFADEELLSRAGLRRPLLARVYEALHARGLTGADTPPRTVEALEALLPVWDEIQKKP